MESSWGVDGVVMDGDATDLSSGCLCNRANVRIGESLVVVRAWLAIKIYGQLVEGNSGFGDYICIIDVGK